MSKFKNYPSIKLIISKVNPNKRLFFPVPHNEILKQIKNLNTKRKQYDKAISYKNY